MHLFLGEKLLSSIFAPGKPLFYVGCVLLIAVAVVIVVMCLVRKPKFAVKPQSPEALIGSQGVVTETLDFDAGIGLVEIDGQGWAARSIHMDDVLAVGTQVEVVALEGVKLIVRSTKE